MGMVDQLEAKELIANKIEDDLALIDKGIIDLDERINNLSLSRNGLREDEHYYELERDALVKIRSLYNAGIELEMAKINRTLSDDAINEAEANYNSKLDDVQALFDFSVTRLDKLQTDIIFRKASSTIDDELESIRNININSIEALCFANDGALKDVAMLRIENDRTISDNDIEVIEQSQKRLLDEFESVKINHSKQSTNVCRI